jgi:hypothetical protein
MNARAGVIKLFLKFENVIVPGNKLEWPPAANVLKLFCPQFTNFRNKLEGWSLASCLVKCLWVRPGAYPRVEQLKVSSLGSATAAALPANIKLGWKTLQGTNTLPYYENS